MIYILVALEDELSTNPNPEKYTIVYTGVGKVNATHVATMISLRDDCEKIINYGTAGAFSKLHVGSLLEIGVVRQRDIDARPLVPLGTTPFDQFHASDIRISDVHEYSVSTGDNFVTAQPELTSDCVDMEAYGIAKTCRLTGTPFECYKYITDLADENAAEAWHENVSKGEDKFWKRMKYDLRSK